MSIQKIGVLVHRRLTSVEIIYKFIIILIYQSLPQFFWYWIN